MDLQQFMTTARNRSADNRKYLQSLRRLDPRKVDDAFHEQHEAVFREIDCLNCANCCKTTSPIFYQTDIDYLYLYRQSQMYVVANQD